MTSTPPRRPTPLRNVLYEFALAKPVPDAALVDEFARHYPEYAADLTEYAIELALDAIAARNEPVDKPSAVTAPSVSRAMSRFHNRLHAVRKETDAEAAKAAPAVENPFAKLTRDAIRALAQGLHANTVFVMKLRDRHISLETMTEGFLRRIADELGVRLENIVAHFAAPAYIQSSAHFKAETQPEAGEKQTFEEAVRSCGLTPEQQNSLLNL
jgi:chemotaxis regulatin CheY-phosphate phosphatase CheZ